MASVYSVVAIVDVFANEVCYASCDQVERRYDDCDLDLHDGHAGVLPGARWDVTESAAACSVAARTFRGALFLRPIFLRYPWYDCGPALSHAASLFSR